MKVKVHVTVFAPALVELEIADDGEVLGGVFLGKEFTFHTPAFATPDDQTRTLSDASARFLTTLATQMVLTRACDMVSAAVEEQRGDLQGVKQGELFGGNGEGPTRA